MIDAHRRSRLSSQALLVLAALLLAAGAVARVRTWGEGERALRSAPAIFRTIDAADRMALALLLSGIAAAAWALVLFLRRIRRSDRALEQAARELGDAEREARRNAAFLEGVGLATPDMIYAKDANLRYVYVNPATAAVIGRPIEEILGRRRADFVINDNVEEEYDVADREVLVTGQTHTSEERFTSPDGVQHAYRSTKFALRDRDGAIVGVAGLTIDISEAYAARDALAVSEAKYRSIANAMPALVWSADAQGMRDFYNDRWRQFTGEGGPNDGDGGADEGWGWLDRVHAADRARVETNARRAIAAGEPYGVEYRLVGQNGPRWFLERALPVRDEDGRVCRWEGACIDIEERQAAERRFQDVQAELAHVSRLSAMGEMASALAHELNQPLSATANYIQGSLRLLREEPVDRAVVSEALTIAGEQMFRAGDIIRRLRDFVSKGETERRIENLPQLLEEAGALAMVGAKDRGVRLAYDIAPAVGAVMVDKVQIQQVVLNLMRNAVEAMSEAPVRELTVAAAAAADDMVVVSVSDTGPGLSREIAGQLFQPFVTTKQDGMGVGLSISRTIVEAHGGRIWAQGEPGKGATFHFTVRAVHEQEMAYGEVV